MVQMFWAIYRVVRGLNESYLCSRSSSQDVCVFVDLRRVPHPEQLSRIERPDQSHTARTHCADRRNYR
jgi:hypothetical protein